MAFGLGERDSVKDEMIEHKSLNLNQMTVRATAIFGLNPAAFNDLFLTNSCQYNTKNKSQVIPRCYTTNLDQQSICFGDLSICSVPVSINGKKKKVLRRLPKTLLTT